MKINLKNFSYQLPGASKALFSVEHFEIPEGQKVLIRGSSGSGKSSFLHALSGLIPSARGEVLYNDISLLKMNLHDRTAFRSRHLGLVFQKLSLLDHFSLLENMMLENENITLATSLAKDFRLSHRCDTLVRNLSLGEQQRVAIARVMMKNFSVLIVDEPTSSLDDESTDLVMKKLLEASQGKTFLCVSHDHRIQKSFDRVIELTQWSGQ
jgi:putative ABC transport system ATP-binding protein